MWIMLLAAVQAEPSLVVTGRRLGEAFAECRQGKCTPLQDARVSVAMAEKQFRDGDYRSARSTLRDAIGRNKRFARKDPKPVAALYEAYGTVARHDGDMRLFRSAIGWQYRTLRDHLTAKDPAVSDACVALGDMWLRQGNANDADAAYVKAERFARAAGSDVRLLTAALRRIGLANMRRDTVKAARLMEALDRDPAATAPLYRTVLSALALRLAIVRSDQAEIARLLPRVSSQPGGKPILLSAPPLPRSARAQGRDHARKFDLVDSFTPRAGDTDGLRWADVGF